MMEQERKGFTLIELLIVVAIIGIIAAVAVPNLLIAIQRAKSKSTLGTMRVIGTALGTYQVDYSFYPVAATEDTWSSVGMPHTYYNGKNRDAWNGELHYLSANGTSYTLTSYGRDLSPGCGTDPDFTCDISLVDGNFNR